MSGDAKAVERADLDRQLVQARVLEIDDPVTRGTDR